MAFDHTKLGFLMNSDREILNFAVGTDGAVLGFRMNYEVGFVRKIPEIVIGDPLSLIP